ncbi:hypothetical protein [Acidimangrovimonas pyrenivorans]|uniref:Sulfotransferase n=1 Tax=Acidimangrovimonas pyrenivorans TaxID=2030798 RepID=A0ABV7ABW3_9RHOB
MSRDFVFIVSGGRTGTQYFGDLMGEMIEGAHSVHEPDLASPWEPARMARAIRQFGLWHMVIGRVLGRTGIRNIATRRLRGRIDTQAAIAAIRRQRDGYYASLSAPLIVESYYQWAGLLPELRALHPTARIIGIVRDPRDLVAQPRRPP